MTEERRRYFRINETVGLSIQILDREGKTSNDSEQTFTPNAIALVSQHDDRIERLVHELEDEHPKIAQIAALLNQKLERVASLLAMESSLLDRIAHRVQEVNISACGMAFSHEEPIPEGTQIHVELTLYPEETKIVSDGLVVSNELTSGDTQNYYCRVDFIGMSGANQETLIQHIVQSQSSQLKARRST